MYEPSEDEISKVFAQLATHFNCLLNRSETKHIANCGQQINEIGLCIRDGYVKRDDSINIYIHFHTPNFYRKPIRYKNWKKKTLGSGSSCECFFFHHLLLFLSFHEIGTKKRQAAPKPCISYIHICVFFQSNELLVENLLRFSFCVSLMMAVKLFRYNLARKNVLGRIE